MPDLRPGDLNIDQTDFTPFNNSMAALMEEELNRLLEIDGLLRMPDDATDREVRDRRRFMIAIARGIVRHLVENNDAFTIDLDETGIVNPTIASEQL